MTGEDVRLTVRPFEGPHRDLLWSFREADDSDSRLDDYVDLGQVWVVCDEERVVGHLQVVPRDADVWEVTNTAVTASYRGRGAGRALLEARWQQPGRPAYDGSSSRPPLPAPGSCASTSVAGSA